MRVIKLLGVWQFINKLAYSYAKSYLLNLHFFGYVRVLTCINELLDAKLNPNLEPIPKHRLKKVDSIKQEPSASTKRSVFIGVFLIKSATLNVSAYHLNVMFGVFERTTYNLPTYTYVLHLQCYFAKQNTDILSFCLKEHKY